MLSKAAVTLIVLPLPVKLPRLAACSAMNSMAAKPRNTKIPT